MNGPAPGPWRAREREWVWLCGAFAVACIVFSAWPGVDLLVAALPFDAVQGFVVDRWPWVRAVHRAVPWFGRGAGLVALLVALLFWRRPGRLGVRWWRRLMVLGLSMALGTGLVVNGFLKEGWGRARPVEIQEFGGAARFTPALQPARQCRSNCAFTSGHAATGFTLLAVGSLAAPATRRRWLVVGLLAGSVLGALRIAQGGHFLSDVVFSGLFVWLATAALREAWLRVKARRRRQLRTLGG